MPREDEVPTLDYGRAEPRAPEPWQPTKAAKIALIVLGSLLVAFVSLIAALERVGAFDD